jgi:hypothetical protein
MCVTDAERSGRPYCDSEDLRLLNTYPASSRKLTLRRAVRAILGEIIAVPPSSHTMTLGLRKEQQESSWEKGWPSLKADNLAAIFLHNVGASTAHNLVGLHGLLQGSFTFLFYWSL